MRILLLTSLVLLAPACVERRLTIRSEPPGATAVLGGRVLDRPTPVAVSLDHPGAHRLEVEMPSTSPEDPVYRRETRVVETPSPWYEFFPFDLFAEVLWPGTLVTETVVDVKLEPVPASGPPEEELDVLLEEADAARAETAGDE